MEALKTYFNWSTGKDSALALYHLLNNKTFSVEHLLVSVNAHHDRVSMHGLRRSLMQKQMDAVGLPFTTIELPETPGMAEYENLMRKTVESLKSQGFDHTAFGDIFLEDLRTYREQQLQPYQIKAHFPLWKRNTTELLHEFLDLGFKAIVVCTKAELLDVSFCGRVIDHDFIKDLPPNVDPCGENGEFHTFCYDGPIFEQAIPFAKGELVYREYEAPKNAQDNCFSANPQPPMGFWYCDLL